MSAVRVAERAYRSWSSPILLELKEREHQLDPSSRLALSNVLQERQLLDSGPAFTRAGHKADRQP